LETSQIPETKRVTSPIPRLSIGQATHPGLVRSVNEDSFGWFSTKSGELLVIADGMGGHAGGEAAGKTAVTSFHKSVETIRGGPLEILKKALVKADQHVSRLASEDLSLAGMGSTLAALLINGYTAWYIHAGDSRIYLLRGLKLECLTKDHSLVQELLDSGRLSAEEAERSDQRHVITQSLGGHLSPEAVTPKQLICRPGDLFLLCTDGLTELVSEPKIQSILTSKTPIQSKAQDLVDEALKAGGGDNVTVQLVQLDFPKASAGQDPLKPAPRSFWKLAVMFLIGLLLGAAALFFWQHLDLSKKTSGSPPAEPIQNLSEPEAEPAPAPVPAPDNLSEAKQPGRQSDQQPGQYLDQQQSGQHLDQQQSGQQAGQQSGQQPGQQYGQQYGQQPGSKAADSNLNLENHEPDSDVKAPTKKK
jgi:serine/threonine protein phosphatase PrpC